MSVELELIGELMTTTWGQVAVVGTLVSFGIVWLLYVWESIVAEQNRTLVTLERVLPFKPHVKAKFRTFETPFKVYKKTEPGCALEALKAVLSMPGILLAMIVETINDFRQWSRANYMFYVGVAGFTGLYYGSMLLLTNPVVQKADKTVYILVALMLLFAGYEYITKHKEEEHEPESSVAI